MTNKTISRWENGNYMPDIEMMELLSEVLHISINELLAGEIISDENFRQKADENIIAIAKDSVFSFDERKKYLIKKWRREHKSFFCVLLLIGAAAFALPFVFDLPWLFGLALVVGLIEYAVRTIK